MSQAVHACQDISKTLGEFGKRFITREKKLQKEWYETYINAGPNAPEPNNLGSVEDWGKTIHGMFAPFTGCPSMSQWDPSSVN